MTPLQALFDCLAYEDMWEDAMVKDCVIYARSSNHIAIPPEWRRSLPTEL